MDKDVTLDYFGYEVYDDYDPYYDDPQYDQNEEDFA